MEFGLLIFCGLKKKGKLCFSLSELDIMKDVPGISC